MSLERATQSYFETILRYRPDEKAFLDSSLMGIGALDADDIEDTGDSVENVDLEDTVDAAYADDSID